jgi:hypothetical protein
MTDIADRAEDEIEMDLEQSRSLRRPEAPPPCGVCLYCDAMLRDGMRWCDTDCRDAWQLEQARRHE